MKPTMLDQSYYETANEIISRYPLEEKSLIPIIQDIQATYRYLPPDLLDYVAKKIGITETKAYSVASFYENFSFEQKGKYVLKICDGTACHVRKSTPVLQYLRQELGLSETKQTTDDLMFTVEVVSCLGACGLAPAMMVNYAELIPCEILNLSLVTKKYIIMVVLQVQNDEDRKKRRKGVKPTMLDQSYYETANEIISRYPLEEKSLIPIIQDIQATYRYLPPDLLDYVAKKIGITETKAYSVASFYENFSFEQKGKYVLKICDGTACHVRKSTPVLQYLRQELGLSETKQTTDDLMFTVEVVSCLGACGLAPAMMVNEQVHPKMTPEKAAELLKELRAKEEEGRNDDQN